jgi:putative SOS response-associated peptidase YedK
MCTRFLLLEKHYQALLQRLGVASPSQLSSRYNIAPSSAIPAVRVEPNDRSRSATLLRWGLVPAWAKSIAGPPLVNARAESVATKPTFRDSLRTRRCVIPASGFYEWETVGRTKKPWLVQRRDQDVFGFAGIWDSVETPAQPAFESCAIITTEPNEVMQRIHDRMPVMLTEAQCEAWLSPDLTDPEKLAGFLSPPPNDFIQTVAVSRHVSNVRNDDINCLAPAEADDQGPQLSLGL